MAQTLENTATGTAAGLLDGRRFAGVILEKGQTSGDADTLVFADGRFSSTACEEYGYGGAPYTATREGDAIRFSCETRSSRYGSLEWNGQVRGDKLDATVIRRDEGKPPQEYWAVAGQD
ncbi:hypothetical protein [Pseudothauera rhizosphaerae]|uniref:Uncharacterized protein n=1 Tax=Pseudothauera rhizosphaerae TaxID=2565932 RepID=A0A4S4ATL0_9RHOO|nr:hypothetical protein [Pseudothauera rhizosphaerae]THF63269.1 hypothetical protein E6O51_04155 [Pseudothauera rhizosphaerae]